MKQKLITGVFILFAIVTKAQQPGKPPEPPSIDERMKRVTEQLKNDLNLDNKQQAVLYEAFKKFFYAADEVRKPDSPPPPPPPPDPKVKAAMEKLENARDEEIKKVLTPDQYQKYKEAAKKMRPPVPPPPAQK